MTINYILTNTSLQDGIELAYKAGWLIKISLNSLAVNWFSCHSVPVCGESTNLIAEIDVEKSMKTLYHLGSNWHYYFCTYTITAPKKTRIQFHIKQIGEHKYYRNYYSDLSASKMFLKLIIWNFKKALDFCNQTLKKSCDYFKH